MSVPTRSLGICQSDLLVRSALTKGLAEIVQDPQLLDRCFAWLTQDDETSDDHGEQELVRIKDWFAQTKIRVVMAEHLEKSTMPCLTVMITQSDEIKGTVGETFYETSEPGTWPNLTSRFNPLHYDPDDGTLILPELEVEPVAGMVLVTRTGRAYAIADTLGENTVELQAGIGEELNGSVLKAARPRQVPLQGGQFQEQYLIGCYSRGDQQGWLLWLHTIAVFILLRRRADLLEARGLQTCSIKSGEVRRGEVQGEPTWSRVITLSGQVTHVWPGFERDAVSGASVGAIRAARIVPIPKQRTVVERLLGEEPEAAVEGEVVVLGDGS